MSKELKASVLAKCGELEKGKPHSFGAVEVAPYNTGYFFQLEDGEILFWVSDKLKEDSPRWAAAAQILGIQEARPEPRPSDDLLREAWDKASAFGWVLCAAGTDKRDYIDARKESFNEWLATIKNSSNALEQGINE